MENSGSSNQKSGKTIVGLILLGLGFILLFRTLDLFFIPSWIFSWPVFLIIIGIFIGKRQGFNRPSAFMPIVIGVIFLSNKILPDMDLGRFFWPLLIIGFGVWMISSRKEKNPLEFFEWDKEKNSGVNTNSDSNEAQTAFETANFLGDRINSASIFGGIKKNIVSKNFQGGDIVNFFGGSEINLMQADIKGRVKIEVVQVFGGTKIIVPANWIVQSEMLAIFGGIEDKRPPQLNTIPDKILIIEGTSIFGGIDIKSF
jgi:predicted membrane protein